jgi:hypothetical protein
MSGELQDLMLVLGIEAAASTKQLTSYWALQQRHDDGLRWVDVAQFVTRSEGEDAHARVAAAAPDVDLRLVHVRRQH